MRPESACAPAPQPLSSPQFRAIWLASFCGNGALLILGVGAAWLMSGITASPRLVAAVQTAMMIPVMLFGMTAGAIADVYDTRRVALVALGVGGCGAALLAASVGTASVNSASLLLGCFLAGSGAALFAPAWQVSVRRQVPDQAVAQAIALNGIGYNVTRSIGPAIGGVIVAVGGASASFAAALALYLSAAAVFLCWQPAPEKREEPAISVGAAILSGIAYVAKTAPVRALVARALAIGMAGGSLSGLLPLVARRQLAGGADLYGILLGLIGLGSLIGAALVARLRVRFRSGRLVGGCTVATGICYAVIGSSGSVFVTGATLFLLGAAWVVMVTVLNIGVQSAVPHWIAGRTLAAYQAAIVGGVALGSWVWGVVAEEMGPAATLVFSGAVCAATAGLTRWLPVPDGTGLHHANE
ncbi:MFS transporter [Novosphingobium sp. P6W]|uniref:MFS transporter n=1 Tax=Novosphingobium sp. P6W TaxID=1609758 RepID=UPI0006962359|nr:MFS transporter [Novosphingobium sp. P6W]AXB80264.1 MFS transporter [Novosphingobium sp. P6W]